VQGRSVPYEEVEIDAFRITHLPGHRIRVSTRHPYHVEGGRMLECPRHLDGQAATAGDETGCLGKKLHIETGPAEHLVRARDIEQVDAAVDGNANQHETGPSRPGRGLFDAGLFDEFYDCRDAEIKTRGVAISFGRFSTRTTIHRCDQAGRRKSGLHPSALRAFSVATCPLGCAML
jgi:hypothetical protein